MSKTVHCDMYLLYRQKVDSAEREPINALLESLAASCYKVGLTNVCQPIFRAFVLLQHDLSPKLDRHVTRR